MPETDPSLTRTVIAGGVLMGPFLLFALIGIGTTLCYFFRRNRSVKHLVLHSRFTIRNKPALSLGLHSASKNQDGTSASQNPCLGRIRSRPLHPVLPVRDPRNAAFSGRAGTLRALDPWTGRVVDCRDVADDRGELDRPHRRGPAGGVARRTDAGGRELGLRNHFGPCGLQDAPLLQGRAAIASSDPGRDFPVRRDPGHLTPSPRRGRRSGRSFRGSNRSRRCSG